MQINVGDGLNALSYRLAALKKTRPSPEYTHVHTWGIWYKVKYIDYANEKICLISEEGKENIFWLHEERSDIWKI